MKVIKISEVEPQAVTGKMFIGKMNAYRLVDENVATGLRVVILKMEAGARNLLHTHTNEQVLFITEGKGIVATEKEEVTVTPGMVVYIPAEEKHWHGATKNTPFSYISIQTPGKVSF